MKVKAIVNNCISDIVKNDNFNKIYIYGSENLELEKLIYKLTQNFRVNRQGIDILFEYKNKDY